jgi:hypothetical protein
MPSGRTTGCFGRPSGKERQKVMLCAMTGATHLPRDAAAPLGRDAPGVIHSPCVPMLRREDDSALLPAPHFLVPVTPPSPMAMHSPANRHHEIATAPSARARGSWTPAWGTDMTPWFAEPWAVALSTTMGAWSADHSASPLRRVQRRLLRRRSGHPWTGRRSDSSMACQRRHWTEGASGDHSDEALRAYSDRGKVTY